MKVIQYNDLPSELVDVIFDELWNNTPNVPGSTLQKRSLVCSCLPVSRDFRHRILSRFCRTVYLFHTPGERYITRLKEVISPPLGSRLGGIGRYINQFSLHVYNEETASDIPRAKVLRKIIHLLDCEDLAPILKGLHGKHFGVTEFCLDIASDYEGSVAWADIPVGFRSAFQGLLQSPRLTRLEVRNLAFPSEAFFNGGHLKSLSIKRFPRIFETDSPGNEVDMIPLTISGLPCPPLEELHTDHSHDFLPASMLEKLKVFRNCQASGFGLRETVIDEFFMRRTVTDRYWTLLDPLLTGPHFPSLRHFRIFLDVTTVFARKSLEHLLHYDESAVIALVKPIFGRLMSETSLPVLEFSVSLRPSAPGGLMSSAYEYSDGGDSSCDCDMCNAGSEDSSTDESSDGGHSSCDCDVSSCGPEPTVWDVSSSDESSDGGHSSCDCDGVPVVRRTLGGIRSPWTVKNDVSTIILKLNLRANSTASGVHILSCSLEDRN